MAVRLQRVFGEFSVNAVFYFPRVYFTSYLTPSKRNMSFQVSKMYIWFLEFVFLVFVSFLSIRGNRETVMINDCVGELLYSLIIASAVL